MKLIGYDNALARLVLSFLLGAVAALVLLALKAYITFDFKALAKSVVATLSSLGVIYYLVNFIKLRNEIREFDLSVFPKMKSLSISDEREEFLYLWLCNNKKYIADFIVFIILFAVVTVGSIKVKDPDVNYYLTSLIFLMFAIYSFLLSLSIRGLSAPGQNFKNYLQKQKDIEIHRTDLIETLVKVRAVYKEKNFEGNKEISLKDLLQQKQGNQDPNERGHEKQED